MRTRLFLHLLFMTGVRYAVHASMRFPVLVTVARLLYTPSLLPMNGRCSRVNPVFCAAEIHSSARSCRRLSGGTRGRVR